MAEKPPESLFNRLLSSGTKGDLLTLFHKNPGLIDTVDGVARRIGKRDREVTSDLMDLVGTGVVDKKVVGKSEVFYLNRKKDRDAQEEMANYLMSLKK